MHLNWAGGVDDDGDLVDGGRWTAGIAMDDDCNTVGNCGGRLWRAIVAGNAVIDAVIDAMINAVAIR